MISTEVAARFWDKVERGNDCWEWAASKNERGYGYFRFSGKTGKAHRFSFIMHNGDIPADRVVDHRCKNPSCVRPDHLRLLTHGQNVLIGRGHTARNARKTHCKRGHPLSGDNLLASSPGRECKACKLLRFHKVTAK